MISRGIVALLLLSLGKVISAIHQVRETAITRPMSSDVVNCTKTCVFDRSAE